MGGEPGGGGGGHWEVEKTDGPGGEQAFPEHTARPQLLPAGARAASPRRARTGGSGRALRARAGRDAIRQGAGESSAEEEVGPLPQILSRSLEGLTKPRNSAVFQPQP